MTTRRRLAYRSGFTLVELLVVITIIGVLVSLTVVGIAGAIQTAKTTRIKVEIDNLSAAFEAYKAKYGDYPPCNLSSPGSNSILQAHISNAFPRYNMANLATDLTAAGVPATANPQAALVFWLQGFSPDVTQPFTGGGQRIPLFDFDKTRLISNPSTGAVATPAATGAYPGSTVYNSPYGSTAYAYFDNKCYGPTSGPSFFAATNPTGSAGTVTAYILDLAGNGTTGLANDTFAKPTSFQIISAGLDGQFSGPGSLSQRFYPTGIGYDSNGADDDNVTNFCDRSKLGDVRP